MTAVESGGSIAPVEGETQGLDAILAAIHELRGVDFRRYRRGTIERRTRGRMLLAHSASYPEYLDRLHTQPDEVDRLIEYLTIKVSRFFRDRSAFEMLRTLALPDLAARHPHRPLRLWSAGCGNGEESYSLAMLLADAHLEGPLAESRVCGSDVDPRALRNAGTGVYAPEAVADLTPEQILTHFTVESGRTGHLYRVRDSLRARVSHLRHDLAAPFPEAEGAPFDLVCCRNVLIYFDRDLRDYTQKVLRDSLVPGGYLCLGESEWLMPALQPSFRVVDRKVRLFQRVAAEA